ncbi:hypothetical protein GCM10010327_41300 [Streptomyces nitrosporeus]|nr:hypothetical protein GCM10010327_41300 [Streptomyces nitrosporeus]
MFRQAEFGVAVQVLVEGLDIGADAVQTCQHGADAVGHAHSLGPGLWRPRFSLFRSRGSGPGRPVPAARAEVTGPGGAGCLRVPGPVRPGWGLCVRGEACASGAGARFQAARDGERSAAALRGPGGSRRPA